MEEAAAKGHFLFLNSGRSFANIPKTLLEFTFLKGIAAGGGAHVLLTEAARTGFPTDRMSDFSQTASCYQTIYHKWVSEEVLEVIFTWYGKQKDFCILEGERDCYIINPSPPFPLRMPKDPVPVNSLDDFKRKSSGDRITKVTLDGFASEDECRLLEPFFRVNSFSEYSEAIIKGENKGKAMVFILNTLGIGREDSIAIGDSANDLDMFHAAGLSVAMGNASDGVKAAAGAVTADCGKGGVAEALRKFVLRQ